VDDEGKINYPYEYARGTEGTCYAVKKHCSFCCSLLKPEFLRKMDFEQLDPTKHWYDVQISHEALNLGFKNYFLPICQLSTDHIRVAPGSSSSIRIR
jgi:hypothetical protein